MRTAAFVFAALFVLSGCATQEPAKVVDAGCEGVSCQAQRAETSQPSIPAPDACDAVRLAAEDCRLQKGACEQQLQAAQRAQTEAENGLAEKGAGLNRCQADLATLQQQAKLAEDRYLLNEAVAQQLQAAQTEAEKALTERGAELGRCLDDMAAIHEQARSDEDLCLQNQAAAEQELQTAQAEAEKALAERGAELGRCLDDMAAIHEQARTDEDLCLQNQAVTEQELLAAQAAQAEAEQTLTERDVELGRCLDDMAAIHEQARTDEDLCLQNQAATEQELLAAQTARAEAEQALAEHSAELAGFQSDLVALQQQADADAERCRQDVTDIEQLLQAMQRVQTESEASLTDKDAELGRCLDDMAAIQQQAETDADRFRQDEEETARQLEVLQGAQLEAEEGLAEKDAELGRCRDDLATFQEKSELDLTEREEELARCQDDLTTLQDKVDADTLAYEGMRQIAQQHAKDAETAARQLQRMKELEERLRLRLQTDIEAKDVEIERLRSQLSVRVLDRILFQSGSADIMPRGSKVLKSVASALEGGDETIRVEGHTDAVPIGPNLKKKYYSNWELSTARASSVVRFFQDNQGIAPTRMEAVGFSKYRPIAPNDTETNRQRNRRVEIKLTPWSPVMEKGEP